MTHAPVVLALALLSAPVRVADHRELPPGEAPAPAPPATGPAHVLTVSGGISLGSYEAGLTWAMVRYLKLDPGAVPRRRLLAATGASAGNINAFLAAATWCQDDASDRAEDAENNLFWRAWIPIGWDRLFPEDARCSAYLAKFPRAGFTCDHDDRVYQPDDGVFTRKAFKEIEGAFERHVGRAGRFRQGCELDVGVTLTKTSADRVRDPTLGLEFETQRHAVLLRAATRADGSFGFHDPGDLTAFPDAPGRSQLLHLPRDGTAQVRVADVLSVIEASSAFPIAFGPKAIGICPDDRGGPVGTSGFACEGRAATERFVDGGVFDNLPLGLALTLRSTREPPPEGLRFVSIDPEARRPHAERGAREPEARGRGLSFLADLLGSLVGVARQYELQIVARLLEENPKLGEGRTFALTTRYFPIFGEHLGAFAGFLAEPFRRFDFRVGVYDGLAELAQHDCLGAGVQRSDKVAFATCTAEKLRAAHDAILPGSEPTSYVVRRVFASELAAGLDRAQLEAVRAHRFADGDTVGAWLAAVDGRNDLLALLVRVNADLDRRLRPELHGSTDAAWEADAGERFDWLLGELAKGGAAEAFGDERGIIEDPVSWQRRTFVRAAQRLLEIEKADADVALEPVREVWEFALRTDLALRHEGVDLDPSSIPDDDVGFSEVLFHLAPHRLGRDPIRERWELGWRPTLGLSPHAAIALPLSLGAELGPTRLTGRAGPGFVLRPGGSWGFLFSELEAAPFLETDLDDRGGTGPRLRPGGELALSLVGGKLRLAGSGTLDGDEVVPGFTFGLADLNGFLYWILRWAG